MYDMKLEVTDSKLIVDGNIKTSADSKRLKDAIATFLHNKNHLTIKVNNSLVITSEVLGYLIKLAKQDSINTTLKCGNPHLIELLENLNLKDSINIIKI